MCHFTCISQANQQVAPEGSICYLIDLCNIMDPTDTPTDFLPNLYEIATAHSLLTLLNPLLWNRKTQSELASFSSEERSQMQQQFLLCKKDEFYPLAGAVLSG